MLTGDRVKRRWSGDADRSRRWRKDRLAGHRRRRADPPESARTRARTCHLLGLLSDGAVGRAPFAGSHPDERRRGAARGEPTAVGDTRSRLRQSVGDRRRERDRGEDDVRTAWPRVALRRTRAPKVEAGWQESRARARGWRVHEGGAGGSGLASVVHATAAG